MKDSREHIVTTATHLFLQKGFKEVTMKELVESAGVSKGAFYHYFTSKEQVFEEVALSFFYAERIKNYDALSSSSLKEFYTGLAKAISGKEKQKAAGSIKPDFTQNHYYLLSDGLRLIPSFRKAFDEEQVKETKAWMKIIEKAKNSGEVKSPLSAGEVAKLFMAVADGLGTNLLLQNKAKNIHAEVLKAWNSIYSLIT